jgi:hypothetical protein
MGAGSDDDSQSGAHRMLIVTMCTAQWTKRVKNEEFSHWGTGGRIHTAGRMVSDVQSRPQFLFELWKYLLI